MAMAAVMVSGCATPGTEGVLTAGGPSMVDLYRGAGQAGGPAEAERRPELRCRMVTRFLGRRRVERCRRGGERVPPPPPAPDAGYSRDAANELRLLFPRVPNPDILIYVYPHLATEARVPVPGYTTAVPLYERVEYALPGDFPPYAGARWPATPVETEEGAEDSPGGAGEEALEAVPAEAEGAEPVEEDGGAEATETGVSDGDGEAAEAPGEVVDGAGEAADAEEGSGVDSGAGAVEETPVPVPEVEPAPPDFAVVPPPIGYAGCTDVVVRRGSLKKNAERLVGECGYRFGEWPGTEDAVVDWVIEEGYAARVDGLVGLLRLLGGYGLTGTVRERERRVDFRKEAK